MSNAKRGGGIHLLYNDGTPRRTPWYLNTAISHALTVLSWFELMDEDRPPESIWLDDDALTSHFEAVDQRRDAGIRGETLVPQAAMDQNELTADLRR